MSLDGTAVRAIFDALESHSLTSGLFERVNTHEPKSAPGNGFTTAIWAQTIGPAPANSGLASTTAVIVFMQRIYTNMFAEPQDAIDPDMLTAVTTMLTTYSGDFELGGNARNIDLLGQTGRALSAQAGYLNQDGRLFRVYDITLPVIVNDAWDQVG